MIKFTKTLLTLFAGFSILAANAAAAEQPGQFSQKQKEAINNMIRDYILEHPEILPEAIQILQSRAKKAMLQQNHTRLYDDGFSYIGGNPKGDVTLIEFFDYNCSYCKGALRTLERLKKEDSDLRIIYKELPVLSESSYIAAKAAMAAMKQGKYEQFHIALLKNTGNLTEERIFEIARDVGLDEQALAKDMTSPLMDRNLQINHSLAEALEINGTPGFVIGDAIIPGAVPYEELVKIIARTRRQLAEAAK